MLTKKSAGAATAQGRLARAVSGMRGRTIDRRTFLKRSGVTAGAAAFADVEKARRLIGFEAKVPLDEGLERLVSWWKSQ